MSNRVTKQLGSGGSSGGGLTVLTLVSGSLNQPNFLFSGVPKVVVVDHGDGITQTSLDGTTNWTGTNPIALTVWPTADIIALG
jgi:hypothetical protein